ncbi:spermatogenesis-associated protein 4 [Eleutherodactylus coqui]|uniref:spermatogenesis-associated protein 4 n=1 Tax=Eleutherodactylus coqui TaxID=57060 RepID=UPI0034623AEF
MLSYPEAPKRTGVPREVIKWLQSLDLSYCPRNYRRDLSNGFITAEIFSRYYPDDIQMHSFGNGTSLNTKLGNWSQLEKFFIKRNLNFSKEVIDGTIHCKPGAAELLLQEIYVMVTHRRVKGIQDGDVDFTDRHYQDGLPMVARSTATKAVKSNITLSEILAEPDIDVNKQKVQAVISDHYQQRQRERMADPKRFNIKPSLAERAVRLMPSSEQNQSETSLTNRSSSSSSLNSSQTDSQTNVTFKEINVNQGDRSYVSSSLSSTTPPSTLSGP